MRCINSLSQESARRRSAEVRVSRADMVELLHVFAEIDENNGDGRTHLATIRDLRQRLTRLAIEP